MIFSWNPGDISTEPLGSAEPSLGTAVIDNVIRNTVHKLYNSNHLQKVESTYVCIPYTPILSEKIKGILGQYNIRIANRTFNTLGSIYSQLKDKIESTKESNVIYKISCLLANM